MTSGPNPLRAAWSMLYARRVRAPSPRGRGLASHSALAEVLDRMAESGVRSLPGSVPHLEMYRSQMEQIDPDALPADGSLAYWINLYNAGALHRAGTAFSNEYDSVLRLPGAFSSPWATVAGETLTLDDIEHGKIRRFGDPRIHSALVCGSVSCPTLRAEAYDGNVLDAQLDDQMRSFLASGGARLDRSANVLHLTRILKWYGADFASPTRMPTLMPVRPDTVAESISLWLTPEDALYLSDHAPRVQFAPYDWGLSCSVA